MMCPRQIAGSECHKNQSLLKNQDQPSALTKRVELKLAERRKGLSGELWVPGGGFYFWAQTGSALSTSCSVFCNLSLVSPLLEAF